MNNIYDIAMVAVISLMIGAAIVDLKERIIPDFINGIIFILAIVALVVDDSISLESRILGFFAVSGFMLLCNMAIKDAFGGGDIKLMATTGMFFGAEIVIEGAFLGILISGIWGIILITIGNKHMRDRFALGPFLVFGVLIKLFIEEKGGISMDMYKIVSIAMIAIGVGVLVWYFTKNKKDKKDKFNRLDDR